MNAREIGVAAGRIFQSTIPLNWIFRSQEDQEDFGIDGEIELTDTSSGKALGGKTVFKAQIKGQENCNYIQEGKVLSFSINLERLKYYFFFKVPIILIVVDVSLKKVFWLSLTENVVLRKAVKKSPNQSSFTLHIPVKNIIEETNPSSLDKLLKAVEDGWNFLSINSVNSAIENFKFPTTEDLNNTINDLDNTLFKAYNQKLDLLIKEKKYNEFYQEVGKIVNSDIFQPKDRYTAILYYDYVFKIAPFTTNEQDKLQAQIKIYIELFKLTKFIKEEPYRLFTVGKARAAKFTKDLESLYTNHVTLCNFDKTNPHYFLMNIEIHKLYIMACDSLQKIINHCYRLVVKNQFNILSNVISDGCLALIQFQLIQKERGNPDQVKDLNLWYNNMMALVITFAIIKQEHLLIERIYPYLFYALKNEILTDNEFRNHKNLIISQTPELSSILDDIEERIKTPQNDFDSISTEEQKQYYSQTAKQLHMDPDNKDCQFGGIVFRALENYDPSQIMKNCESLFVHYRPGGIVADQLSLHSAGGIHLLVCLKDKGAMGTGGLLKDLYPNFKNKYCESCSECKPREQDWQWSLKWHREESQKLSDKLERYNRW